MRSDEGEDGYGQEEDKEEEGLEWVKNGEKKEEEKNEFEKKFEGKFGSNLDGEEKGWDGWGGDQEKKPGGFGMFNKELNYK